MKPLDKISPIISAHAFLQVLGKCLGYVFTRSFLQFFFQFQIQSLIVKKNPSI